MHIFSNVSGHRRRRGRAVALLVVVVVATVSVYFASSALAADENASPRIDGEAPVTSIDFRSEHANNSPSLAADPTEAGFVALASRVDSPDFDCRLHVSGDSGASWVPARPVSKLPQGAEKCYAPEVAFDGGGRLYYLFVGLQGLGNAPMGAFLTSSTDRGRTFTTPRRVLGADRYMVRMAIDPREGKAGRIHLVWLETGSPTTLGGFGPPPNPILAAYSDDGGKNFSSPVQVSDPERGRVVAPALALGADSSVNVAYYDLGDDAVDYQGLEGDTWERNWTLALSSSSDGGRHFEAHSIIDSDIAPPERVMLVFTMPPPSLVTDGRRIFVSWWDARRGDWDVLFRRSTNGGSTWDKPIRLNDDKVANGRHQYLPRLSVAPTGRVDAIFYDRRRDTENVRNDVYYSFSKDRGATFSQNIKLTSRPSDSRIGQRYPIPSAEGLVEFGSRIALLSTRSRVLATWTDTRNSVPGHQHQDVFATRLRLSSTEQSAAFRWPVAGVSLLFALVALVIGLRKRTTRRREDAVGMPKVVV